MSERDLQIRIQADVAGAEAALKQMRSSLAGMGEAAETAKKKSQGIGDGAAVGAAKVELLTGKLQALSSLGVPGLGKLANSMDTATTASKALGTASTGMIAAVGAAAAGITIFSAALAKSVAAASDAEQAQTRLDAALKAQGIYTQEAASSVTAWAEELLKTKGVSDELATTLVAQGVTMGMTIERTEKLIDLAADLAPVVGSVEGAFDALSRAATGDERALKTLGKQFGITSADAMAFDEFLGKLEKKTAGNAAAQVETFAGQWKLLGEQFGNILEAVGTPLLRELTSLLNVANDGVEALASMREKLAEFGATAETVAGQIDPAATGVERITAQVDELARLDAMQFTSFIKLIAAFATVPVGGYNQVTKALQEMGEAETKAVAILNASETSALGSISPFGGSARGYTSKSRSPILMESGDATGFYASRSTPQLVSGQYEDFKVHDKDVKAETEKVAAKLERLQEKFSENTTIAAGQSGLSGKSSDYYAFAQLFSEMYITEDAAERKQVWTKLSTLLDKWNQMQNTTDQAEREGTFTSRATLASKQQLYLLETQQIPSVSGTTRATQAEIDSAATKIAGMTAAEAENATAEALKTYQQKVSERTISVDTAEREGYYTTAETTKAKQKLYLLETETLPSLTGELLSESEKTGKASSIAGMTAGEASTVLSSAQTKANQALVEKYQNLLTVAESLGMNVEGWDQLVNETTTVEEAWRTFVELDAESAKTAQEAAQKRQENEEKTAERWREAYATAESAVDNLNSFIGAIDAGDWTGAANSLNAFISDLTKITVNGQPLISSSTAAYLAPGIDAAGNVLTAVTSGNTGQAVGSVGGTAIGTAVGATFGGPVGALIGASVGSALGSTIGSLFGGSGKDQESEDANANFDEFLKDFEKYFSSESSKLLSSTLQTKFDQGMSFADLEETGLTDAYENLSETFLGSSKAADNLAAAFGTTEDSLDEAADGLAMLASAADATTLATNRMDASYAVLISSTELSTETIKNLVDMYADAYSWQERYNSALDDMIEALEQRDYARVEQLHDTVVSLINEAEATQAAIEQSLRESGASEVSIAETRSTSENTARTAVATESIDRKMNSGGTISVGGSGTAGSGGGTELHAGQFPAYHGGQFPGGATLYRMDDLRTAYHSGKWAGPSGQEHVAWVRNDELIAPPEKFRQATEYLADRGYSASTNVINVNLSGVVGDKVSVAREIHKQLKKLQERRVS